MQALVGGGGVLGVAVLWLCDTSFSEVLLWCWVAVGDLLVLGSCGLMVV